MRASVIFAPHFVHGSSIRRSRNKVGTLGEAGMIAHQTWGGSTTLSVTVRSRWRTGDGSLLLPMSAVRHGISQNTVVVRIITRPAIFPSYLKNWVLHLWYGIRWLKAYKGIQDYRR